MDYIVLFDRDGNTDYTNYDCLKDLYTGFFSRTYSSDPSDLQTRFRSTFNILQLVII